MKPKLSIITPIYNEEKNIPLLFNELTFALGKITPDYEIIAVNDGSKDESFKALSEAAKKDARFKVVNFRMNRGQTAAISAGIEHSSGEILVTIDSDLENDPKDIARLLEKMEEGYDVVSGWRKDRWKGSYLKRKLPSMTANWLISKITRVPLHDYGCILKAYKREVIADTRLYGEMHRFIPAYASWHGARVAEIEVSQRQRIHGKSNYGFSRTFKVLLDLVLVRFLDKYMNKPIHFFGGIGFVASFLGIISGLLSVFLKIIGSRDFVETPLPIFSALLIILWGFSLSSLV
jgi:glycosyltransferase involved in cell wall biosynthesis